MVAGCSLDLAISASRQRAPSDGLSMWRVVTSTFDALGVRYSRLVRGSVKTMPAFCLAFLSDAGRKPRKTDWGHSVVVLDGLVYDPSIGWPMPLRVFEDYIIAGRYTTKKRKAHWASFLPILSEPPTTSPGALSIPG